MNSKTTGFVGGGRLARIFLEGWKRADALPDSLVASDCNPESLAKLKSHFPGVQTAAKNSAAASHDIAFLAVHPPAIAEVSAAGIKDSLKPGALVVSLAPKCTVGESTGLLGGSDRLARVIPNAPSIVNCEFNRVAIGPELTAADTAEVTGLLAPLGECPEVAEEKL